MGGGSTSVLESDLPPLNTSSLEETFRNLFCPETSDSVPDEGGIEPANNIRAFIESVEAGKDLMAQFQNAVRCSMEGCGNIDSPEDEEWEAQGVDTLPGISAFTGVLANCSFQSLACQDGLNETSFRERTAHENVIFEQVPEPLSKVAADVLQQAVERIALLSKIDKTERNTPKLLGLICDLLRMVGSDDAVRVLQTCSFRSPSDVDFLRRSIENLTQVLQAPLVWQLKKDEKQKLLEFLAALGAVGAVGALAWLGTTYASLLSAQAVVQSLWTLLGRNAAVAALESAAREFGMACTSMAMGTAAATAGISGSKLRMKFVMNKYPLILRVILNFLLYTEPIVDDCDILELEKLVVQRWTVDFKNLIHCSIEEILDSPAFSLQTAFYEEKTSKDILLRMRMLERIAELRSILDSTCFVAVVGPESAGKSTLTESLMWSLGKTQGVANIGMLQHTDEVGGYELHDKLWIIDFPASNGLSKEIAQAWQGFCHLPSFCVLVVRFTGDIDGDLVNLYRECKTQFAGTDVVVLLNQVDNVLMKDKHNEFTVEAMTDCKHKFCRVLNCVEDNLLFTVLTWGNHNASWKVKGAMGHREVCKYIVQKAAATVNDDSDLQQVASSLSQ